MKNPAFIPTKPIVGLLCNPCEWSAEAYGRNGFRKKARLGEPAGVELLKIRLSDDNIKSAQRQGQLDCLRHHQGEFVPLKVQFADIAAVYDFYSENVPDCAKEIDPLYYRLANSLEEAGKPFVNPLHIRQVCMDKWKTHQAISAADIPMPATVLYSESGLRHLLNNEKLVFVKNRTGTEGEGQFVVRRHDGEYIARVKCLDVFRASSVARIARFLEGQGVDDNWIAQAGVESMRIDGRVMDFRAIFQRDSGRTLHETATYARLGASGSYHSNIGAEPGKLGFSADPASLLENWSDLGKKISGLGQKAIAVIEAWCGKLAGEAGVDIMLSNSGGLYFIEANTKPGHYGLEWLSKMHGGAWTDSFREFFLRPLRYAKSLCEQPAQDEPAFEMVIE